MIPLSLPAIGDAEIAAVSKVLRSGWLAHGPEVCSFEEEFSAAVGAAHAVALNSCASALQMAIEGLGLKGEIVVPSFTFVATANAVIRAGCSPVFADIDIRTGNVDPESVRACISEQTVAVMPVHFAGQCCDMTRICAIVAEHRLALIEDSAEAIGATWDGRTAGSFGEGCFSFFPTKNLTTAEGGMLTTNNGDLAERVRMLRGHGVSRQAAVAAGWAAPWHRVAFEAGMNLRMNDVQAALGRVQLSRLEELNQKRRAHAAYFDEHLGRSGVQPLALDGPARSAARQMYAVRIDTQRFSRPAVITGLRQRGVEASAHFDPPLHVQPLYAGFRRAGGGLSATDELSASVVTLPMFPDLTEGQRETIVLAFGEAIEAARI